MKCEKYEIIDVENDITGGGDLDNETFENEAKLVERMELHDKDDNDSFGGKLKTAYVNDEGNKVYVFSKIARRMMFRSEIEVENV